MKDKKYLSYLTLKQFCEEYKHNYSAVVTICQYKQELLQYTTRVVMGYKELPTRIIDPVNFDIMYCRIKKLRRAGIVDLEKFYRQTRNTELDNVSI